MSVGTLKMEGLYLATGNPFTVNDSTLPVAGQLGKVGSIGGNTTGLDPGLASKKVQYVKRHASDTATAVAGSLAFWADTDNFVVTADLAYALGGTTFPIVAGVFGAATPAAGNYGCIQIGGVAPLRVTDSTSASTTAAGKVLVWSTNSLVKQRSATDITTWVAEMHKPVVAVLVAGNNATTTTLQVEALLTLGRFDW